jgi:predicted TIM-barrel fold metal-dependent hydrolase
MIDLDKRFEIMDRHEGYRQVLTLSAPPLENVAGPDLSPDLAKMANDEMAGIVERYPDRFPGFVASLPMNNPDAAMREIERAIEQLGATGVQIFTNVNGQPLDSPEYCTVRRMAAIDLPMWIIRAPRTFWITSWHTPGTICGGHSRPYDGCGDGEAAVFGMLDRTRISNPDLSPGRNGAALRGSRRRGLTS